MFKSCLLILVGRKVSHSKYIKFFLKNILQLYTVCECPQLIPLCVLTPDNKSLILGNQSTLTLERSFLLTNGESCENGIFLDRFSLQISTHQMLYYLV